MFGGGGAKKGSTSFQKHKESKAAKQREEEEAAAAVYADFVESFEVSRRGHAQHTQLCPHVCCTIHRAQRTLHRQVRAL